MFRNILYAMRPIRLVAGFLLAAVVFMSEVSESAATNLAWWFDQGGFPSVGAWISRHAPFIAHYAVPSFAAVAVGLLVWPVVARMWAPTSSRQPLRIIFDTKNPGQQFWKRIQATDDYGDPVDFFGWEYRVGIRNTSARTARNVRVSVETLGQMPVDPRDMGFQKDNKQQRDIQPGYTELVPVWWVWPLRPGDLTRTTATAAHGAVRVIVRADDIPPSEVSFEYAHGKTPALVKLSPFARR